MEEKSDGPNSAAEMLNVNPVDEAAGCVPMAEVNAAVAATEVSVDEAALEAMVVTGCASAQKWQ